jgi:eukaryotic-like serine/threonine-protein kinase
MATDPVADAPGTDSIPMIKRSLLLLALLVLFSLRGTLRTPPEPIMAGLQRKLPTQFANQYRMEFVLIPAGKFVMGSADDDTEKPAHSVTIGQSFYMTRYEVTQRQWRAVMTTTVDQQRRKLQLNPRDMPARRLAGEGDDLPMYYVSWEEAQAFIQKLNALKDGHVYRLPTEAEWEYACRGGTTDNAPAELGPYVWYHNNSSDITHAVGMRRVNAFGLYDMVGNVWEWCEDSYHPSYDGAPADGSAWINKADELHQRVTRGGSFFTRNLNFLRCSARGSTTEDSREFEVGFRVISLVN